MKLLQFSSNAILKLHSSVFLTAVPPSCTTMIYQNIQGGPIKVIPLVQCNIISRGITFLAHPVICYTWINAMTYKSVMQSLTLGTEICYTEHKN